MKWLIKFHNEFDSEFNEMDSDFQDELFAQALFLEHFGPKSGRTWVDT